MNPRVRPYYKGGGPKWGYLFPDHAGSLDFDTANKVVCGKACVSSV